MLGCERWGESYGGVGESGFLKFAVLAKLYPIIHDACRVRQSEYCDSINIKTYVPYGQRYYVWMYIYKNNTVLSG